MSGWSWKDRQRSVWHSICVARNNLLRGNNAANLHGIMAGSAIGFIAEGNQLQDLSSGFFDAIPGEQARDIIIRHNYFRNITTGINYSRPSYQVLRMIAHDNLMDIKNGGTGISALGSGSTNVYTGLILRKNIIRNVNWDGTPGTITGINVSRVLDLVVQYNIINNYTSTTGIKRNNCTNMTIGNNIDTTGAAVPVTS